MMKISTCYKPAVDFWLVFGDHQFSISITIGRSGSGKGRNNFL